MAKTPLFRILMSAWNQQKQIQNCNPDRRDFLRKTGFAAGGLAAGSLLSACSILNPSSQNAPRKAGTLDSEKQNEVIIIGAGSAGLAAAYKLSQKGISCRVYEALGDRVGGRMWTLRKFNSDGMFVEMGGELVDAGHENVRSFCKELNLEIEQFPKETNIAEELFWIDGSLRSSKDLERELKPLYVYLRTCIQEIKGSAQELDISWNNPMNATQFDQMNLSQFLDKCPDLAKWVRKVVEIAYTGEMGLDPEDQSALNLITLMVPDVKNGHLLFGESDEGFRVKGGNGQIPERIAGKLDEKYGSREKWLSNHYRLDAIRNRGNDFVLSFSSGNGPVEVKADQVIFAIPFSVLRKVEGIAKLGLHPKKLSSIMELGYGTNSKLMTGFKSQFWRDPKKMKKAYSGALFTDQASQAFWETSKLQSGTQGIITNFTGGAQGKKISKQMLAEPLEDLKVVSPLFKKEAQPFPQLMNWSQSPYAGGSYICLKPGQYTQFYGVESEAELKNRLFFAGEHTSTVAPGFMEGALESGVRAAQQVVDSRS